MTVWLLEAGEHHDHHDVVGVHTTERSGVGQAQVLMAAGGVAPGIEWQDESGPGLHHWERVFTGQSARYPRPDCAFLTLTEWPVL